MNKYVLSSAALIFTLGTQSASAEYMCDFKSYQEIQAAQYNEEGQFVGTSNDGCRNYKAIVSDYYKAGAEPTVGIGVEVDTGLAMTLIDASANQGFRRAVEVINKLNRAKE